MKSATYVARVADRDSKGVIDKVRNTAQALCKLGIDADAIIIHEYWLKGGIKVAFRVLCTRKDLIILRSDHHTMLFMLIPLLWVRMRRKKVVIDIATPACTAIKELEGSDAGFFVGKMKKALLYASYPLSLLPADRILQYGHESSWFSLGVRKKSKIVGNGVLVESVPFRAEKPPFSPGCLNLLGAAHLAFWHGYDRLIRSIHAYNKENESNPNRIHFHFAIAGEGAEKKHLEALVSDLGLGDQVYFPGMKEGPDLARCFQEIHVGVCSLGVHRKNLDSASELKARDYTARGVPFILACDDMDFPDSLPFIYRCKNDETLIDLEEIAEWYEKLEREYDDFHFIRRFAEERLDYTVKVRNDILDVFGS